MVAVVSNASEQALRFGWLAQRCVRAQKNWLMGSFGFPLILFRMESIAWRAPSDRREEAERGAAVAGLGEGEGELNAEECALLLWFGAGGGDPGIGAPVMIVAGVPVNSPYTPAATCPSDPAVSFLCPPPPPCMGIEILLLLVVAALAANLLCFAERSCLQYRPLSKNFAHKFSAANNFSSNSLIFLADVCI